MEHSEADLAEFLSFYFTNTGIESSHETTAGNAVEQHCQTGEIDRCNHTLEQRF
jgi:hypothetical protein